MTEIGTSYNASVCRIKIMDLEHRLARLKPTSPARIRRRERLTGLLQFWQARLVHYYLLK